MHSKKRTLVGALCGVALGLCLVACETTEETATQPDSAAAVSPGTLGLCGGCGFKKGSDMCCKPGQTICSKCNLVKGSPGCCKMNK